MKKITRALITALLLFTFAFSLNADDFIIAKIGIMYKSGEKITKLRSNDRVKAGEEIRIFIQPQHNVYLYVIYSDGIKASLMNYKEGQDKLVSYEMLVLPSETQFYEFDDKSDKAWFNILCSKDSIESIDSLYADRYTVPHSDWAKVSESLEENIKADLSDDTDKPLTIGGNVRGTNDDFSKRLPKFADKKIIMRKYELEVK